MSILDAIIQGIIQGLTEFLPVSSSGHLQLYAYVTGNPASETGFLFSAFLHLGTLLATCIAFWSTVKALAAELWHMVKDLFTGKLFKEGLANPERRMIVMLLLSLVILVPFYFLRDAIEYVAQTYLIALGCFFLYTAVILFLSDRCKKGQKEAGELTWKEALTVGVFQALALFPGISRSGSTICSGLFAGMSRDMAVKYSFMLGIPTILAGCLVEIKDAIAERAFVPSEIPSYIVGFIVAAVVGILAIRLVDLLVKSNKFKYFAVYTLLLGLVVIGFGAAELIR
ncbi:MAG: undecaprenyl-diphosphate phosphatase [Oscillospiraceae bacterium]|nr:undecaprenyl-diphosphate phosphatase [Oscillospiraceae bacterium]